jgi:restriction system protein
MAVWLVRAGKHGEHEHKFFEDKRVYVTWDRLAADLSKMSDRPAVVGEMRKLYPNAKQKQLQNWAAQVWAFARSMTIGDLVAMPLKSQRAIAIGEITGAYQFDPAGPNPYFHYRTVKWIETVPRQKIPQDLLYSLGSVLTICRIQRNDAEARFAAMRKSGWKPEGPLGPSPVAGDDADDEELEADHDLEAAAKDQIARLINARFKGHGLTRLVDAILRAQGYTTYLSPEGADGGADILAGSGPLGFSEPRLCVEVKSEANQIDRPTVDKLLGAVEKFRANHGLFVAWNGYKRTVLKELAGSFFKVRLWTGDDLLNALFENYDKLDEDIRAELPLKQMWTISSTEDD